MRQCLVISTVAAFVISFFSLTASAETEEEAFERITTEIWNTIWDLPSPDETEDFDLWEEYLIELFVSVPESHKAIFLEELGWQENQYEFSKVFHEKVEPILAANLLSLLAPPPSPPTEVSLDVEPMAEELGTICYSDGRTRQITPDQAIWLAKMVDGETWGRPTEQDASAMLWALVQRGGVGVLVDWDLRRLTQAYSQPINPIWTRTGRKCAEYYRNNYSGEVKRSCSLKKVTRREHNISKPWEETAELARYMVLEFAAGRVPNSVPGSVGWFAPRTWSSRESKGLNQKMAFHSNIDGNVYFYRTRSPDTRLWDDLHVTVVPNGAACPG